MSKRVRMIDPTTNGNNGRDGKGRFAPGNPGGPGNPWFRQIGQIRQAILTAATPEDVAEIIRRLVRDAKRGDKTAARLVLERLLGPPLPADFLARMEALENLAGLG